MGQPSEDVSVRGKFTAATRRMKIEIDASMPWWELNIGVFEGIAKDCFAAEEIEKMFKRAQEIDQQNKDEVEL